MTFCSRSKSRWFGGSEVASRSFDERGGMGRNDISTRIRWSGLSQRRIALDWKGRVSGRPANMPSPRDSGFLSHAYPALKRWAFFCRAARRDGVSWVRGGVGGRMSVKVKDPPGQNQAGWATREAGVSPRRIALDWKGRVGGRPANMPSPRDSGFLSHAYPALKRWAFFCRAARRDWIVVGSGWGWWSDVSKRQKTHPAKIRPDGPPARRASARGESLSIGRDEWVGVRRICRPRGTRDSYRTLTQR